jgi:hypothetical protein
VLKKESRMGFAGRPVSTPCVKTGFFPPVLSRPAGEITEGEQAVIRRNEVEPSKRVCEVRSKEDFFNSLLEIRRLIF